MCVYDSQQNDKFYKFLYGCLGIIIPGYFFHEGKPLKFYDNEVVESGKHWFVGIELVTLFFINCYFNRLIMLNKSFPEICFLS